MVYLHYHQFRKNLSLASGLEAGNQVQAENGCEVRAEVLWSHFNHVLKTEV